VKSSKYIVKLEIYYCYLWKLLISKYPEVASEMSYNAGDLLIDSILFNSLDTLIYLLPAIMNWGVKTKKKMKM
jgi:hypothetical protein